MYLDNDYLYSPESIYGIKGNWGIKSQKIIAKPVYKKNSQGDFEKCVDIKGEYGENFELINPKDFQHISSKGIPFEFTQTQTIWKSFYDAFLELGIDNHHIGIFGSYRLGLPSQKDIDFVIYGKENAKKMYQSINIFKQKTKTTSITREHTLYQASTHGHYYDKDINTLEACLMNKWSSCQVQKGICSTIRFVDPHKDNGADMLYIFEKKGNAEIIRGIVYDAISSSFVPRRFFLESFKGEIFEVLSPLWIFHQCVNDRQLVEVKGIVDHQHKKIIVKDYNHGIKIV